MRLVDPNAGLPRQYFLQDSRSSRFTSYKDDSTSHSVWRLGQLVQLVHRHCRSQAVLGRLELIPSKPIIQELQQSSRFLSQIFASGSDCLQERIFRYGLRLIQSLAFRQGAQYFYGHVSSRVTRTQILDAVNLGVADIDEYAHVVSSAATGASLTDGLQEY
jgi:hypothetical protein